MINYVLFRYFVPLCLSACRAGRFASSSEVGRCGGRATQARQVPTVEPDEVCSTTIGSGGGSLGELHQFLLELKANHPHIRKNEIDSETKER
jgi:hypothetical protein